METIWRWVERRSVTVGLVLFFLVWYAFGLIVFHGAGEATAQWWFYLEQPPNHVSPGTFVAPLSHDFASLTHIGTNVSMLLVIGGVAEPYIGTDGVLVPVMGLGYLGTAIANGMAIFHQMWIVAGASGGILALGAYVGLRLRHQAIEDMRDGLTWSSRAVETVVIVSLLIGTPIFLLHQTVLIAQPHSGHAIGILLGYAYYGITAREG